MSRATAVAGAGGRRCEPYALRELVAVLSPVSARRALADPIALVGYMQRDLVETRRWIALEDYKEGLALAQLAPGPLAAQLAIYLGWLDHGVLGATLVAVAFVLPSFLMVLVLSRRSTSPTAVSRGCRARSTASAQPSSPSSRGARTSSPGARSRRICSSGRCFSSSAARDRVDRSASSSGYSCSAASWPSLARTRLPDGGYGRSAAMAVAPRGTRRPAPRPRLCGASPRASRRPGPSSSAADLRSCRFSTAPS